MSLETPDQRRVVRTAEGIIRKERARVRQDERFKQQMMRIGGTTLASAYFVIPGAPVETIDIETLFDETEL